jgi:hypothetical protein
MKRLLCAATAFAALFCGPAAVAGGDRELVTGVDGRPGNFDRGDSARYGLWYVAGEGYHLDVTTAGARRHFKGRIILVDGRAYFREVDSWKGIGEATSELLRDNWFSKHVTMDSKNYPREIDFDFVSEAKNLSGIRFSVAGQANVLWNLCVGGPNDTDHTVCSTDPVRIGQDGHLAPAMPFVTYAHPDRPGDGG